MRGIGGLAFIGNSTDMSRVICTGATLTFTNILKLEITDLGFHSCTIQLDSSSAVFMNSSFKNSSFKNSSFKNSSFKNSTSD